MFEVRDEEWGGMGKMVEFCVLRVIVKVRELFGVGDGWW